MQRLVSCVAQVCAATLLIASAVTGAARAQTQPFDVVIRNGRILDGAGNPWFRSDVGIRGDRIVEIGQLEKANARRTIDAAGQIVAPGFIDIHNHSRDAMFEVPARRILFARESPASSKATTAARRFRSPPFSRKPNRRIWP